MSAIETVWVVPCTMPDHGDLIAFCPAYAIGVAPSAVTVGHLTWFSVTRYGVPLEVIDAPTLGWGPSDLLLFRLSQAYTSLMMATNNGPALPWKA